MTDAKLKIAILDLNCKPLTPVWRTDLVIQSCASGWPYLVDYWPQILTQLKDRYSKPATIVDITDYTGMTDQGGQTIDITTKNTAGVSTLRSTTLQSPAITPEQICAQLQGYPTEFIAELEDGHIRLTTIDKGWSVELTIGGTAALSWGYTTMPITVFGDGYKILSHYYQGAQRIMLQPPSGQYVNRIEVDIPRGCYKIWTRCCFGQNEETGIIIQGVCCDQTYCVNLVLPQVRLCSGALLHPMMREIVKNQLFLNDEERLLPMRALMWQAGLDRQAVLDQLAYQRIEAEEAGLGDMVLLIDDVTALANLLPQCIY